VSLPAAIARPSALSAGPGLLAVATGVNPIASFRKRGKKIFRRHTRSCQHRAYLLAQTLKALLLRDKDEAIPQTQYGKRRTIPQPKVFPILFWNGKLAFFANLGRCQIFQSGIVGCHIGRKILPWNPSAIKHGYGQVVPH
jgi:hypothetical protein